MPHPTGSCPGAGRSFARTAKRWFLWNSLATGILALGWVLLRSGRRPSRLAYPCQRAALSTAMLAFGAPAAAGLATLGRRLGATLRAPLALATLCAALFAILVGWNDLTPLDAVALPAAPLLRAPADYRAQVFHAAGCRQQVVGDRFECLDDLLALMGRRGLKIYRSPQVSDLSGPDGLIAPGDVVVVKINYQWDQRGGSNTDLLRGLVRVLVDHPDGFTGEVVVAENAQFAATSGFDRLANNAEDTTLSPHDVVLHFQGLGYAVSQFDWTALKDTQVSEYSSGDLADGYVLEPYDPTLQARPSYPKFRSAGGAYVSSRYGIWSPGAGSYDRARLKRINLPVLKSHHAVYGATACVKNHMGLVTNYIGTGSHSAIRYGLLGAVMGLIGPPDLNLLDAIWVNGNPNTGPSTPYAGATRRDELVASLDPVAADRWAVANILVPAFLSNGFTPPWPVPSADPDLPSGAFRTYLDQSMQRLLAAGYTVTNDPAAIDLFEIVTLFRDGFEAGDTSAWSDTTP